MLSSSLGIMRVIPNGSSGRTCACLSASVILTPVHHYTRVWGTDRWMSFCRTSRQTPTRNTTTPRHQPRRRHRPLQRWCGRRMARPVSAVVRPYNGDGASEQTKRGMKRNSGWCVAHANPGNSSVGVCGRNLRLGTCIDTDFDPVCQLCYDGVSDPFAFDEVVVCEPIEMIRNRPG